jgi:hypothetical protein
VAPEPETERILGLIERLRGGDWTNDPLRVIQVVNALQPLGKTGAFAVIDDYVKAGGRRAHGSAHEGLFVVVRCLFDVPEPPGYLPPVGLGASYPDPGDPRSQPRFPVVLYRDIPFVGILGYSLFGRAETIGEHLVPYREWGQIRAQPLRPPDNPLEVVDDAVSSPEWPDWGDSDWDRARAMGHAREQVLRLVDPVYPLPSRHDVRLTYAGGEREWEDHRSSFARLNARWDLERNTYVRADSGLASPASV